MDPIASASPMLWRPFLLLPKRDSLATGPDLDGNL